MKKILVGADVLLDMLFDRKPFSLAASQLLSLAENRMVECYLTLATLQNTYTELRNNSTHEKAAESLSLLLTFLEIMPSGKKDVIETLNSDFQQFTNGLDYFVAKNSYKIDVIITTNRGEFVDANLPVITPEEFLQNL